MCSTQLRHFFSFAPQERYTSLSVVLATNERDYLVTIYPPSPHITLTTTGTALALAR